MVRLVAFALAAYCYLQPGLALAQDTARQLTGSWKLTKLMDYSDYRWGSHRTIRSESERQGGLYGGRVCGIRHCGGKSQAGNKQ